MAGGRSEELVGDVRCPHCERVNAEATAGGIAFRCVRCKNDFAVDVRLLTARTDYLLAEKLGKLVDVFSDFISQRERRLVSV